MSRWQWLMAGALLGCAPPAAHLEGGALPVVLKAEVEPGEAQPGGAATLSARELSALQQPVANLALASRSAFFLGQGNFNIAWEPAPFPRMDRDGLGPLFNAVSCRACHLDNARRADGEALLLRLSSATGGPAAGLGSQLQPFAIAGVPREGELQRVEGFESGEYADGSAYVLRRLRFGVAKREGLQVSPRATPALVGMGLLEAVGEETLLQRADPDDVDGDGVSGRPNRVAGVLGRFGAKAGAATVRDQTANALAGDMGLTTSRLPAAPCEPEQSECLAAPSGGEPEVDDGTLDSLAAYVRLLGVPAREDAQARATLAGKALFAALGCAACHRPSMRTRADAASPELRSQLIWPYSDLLLHDLGEGLADGRAEHEASGTEWRTAPLWGLGVQGARPLLHDGRARSVPEAILWHGGEADAARTRFLALPAADRLELERFVLSL